MRRTIAAFNLASIPIAAVVSSADLDLALVVAPGAALPVNAYRMTGGWTTGLTWNSNGAVAWATPGGVFDSSAPIGSATVGPATGHYHWALSTATVQGWINHSIANAGLILKATNEATAVVTRFGSSNNTDASVRPRLTVTYNTPPGQPAGRSMRPCAAQCTGTVLVSSARPDLTGGTTDPDGQQLRYDFEVWAGHAASPTTLVTSGSVPNVTPGQLATWTVPAGVLSAGDYEYRVRAWDGVVLGAWSAGWAMFTVDPAVPATPSLTSTAFTDGGWGTATSGALSYASSDSNGIAGYSWQLDDGDWSTYATATSTTLSGLTDGLHRFSVRAQDRAGNVSAAAVRTFGVGVGGITSPADGDTTQARVTLTGVAPVGRDWLTWRWRLGATGTFATIPTADLTVPGTSTHPTFPAGRDAGSTSTPKAFPSFTWDTSATVGMAADGLVQVQACYGTSATDPSPACVGVPRGFQLSRAGFAAAHATADVGPGTVSLLSGDFQVSESDVDVPTYQGSLSIGRTLTTLAPSTATTGATGIFGPGWVASLPGPDAGAAAMTLTDTSAQGYVTLTDEDGSQEVYVQQGSTSTFLGMGDASADGSTLVKNTATQFTLTDIDGTRTVWTRDAGGHWGPSAVTEPGNASTTTYTRDSAGRVTQILAPVPAGVTCTSPLTTAGCRVLTLVYAASTTATGTAPAQWGDVTGRLSRVDFTAYDPATTAMHTIPASSYQYDSTGLLRAQWDPRISPALKTTYAYDTANRLTTVTPPGLASWTLSYDGAHRLVTASRPDPSGTTATSIVSYGVPFTGAGAPVELGRTATDSWGQTDLPATAAAVWEPDRVPAATPSTTDWQYATLTYLDVNGRPVNTANYGAGAWQITTTEYDTHGNTIRTLSAANRTDALNPASDPYADSYLKTIPDSAQRALLLSDTTKYDPDGIDILETLGPLHPVVLNDGTTASARQHTVTRYDENAPSGGPFHLPTTVTVTAQTPDGTDNDARVTATGYDPVATGDPSGWTLHAATSTTTDPGTTPQHLNLSQQTRYNAAGQTTETRPPAEPSGGGPDTKVTTYYTATGTAPCGGKPQWAGLTCQTAPAAQPDDGDPLPVETTTYTVWDAPSAVTETYGTTTTRTTTTSYDNAGRSTGRTIVVSPTTDGGTAIPAVTTGYDPTTGLQTTTSTTAGTITLGYNTLGRATSYTQTDATGTTITAATRGYDVAGRMTTLTDGKGTTTYSYDTTDDHRGLLTTLTDSQAGTFTATYDADGNVQTQTYPGGLVATTSVDNDANPVQLQYAKAGTTWLTFTQTESAHGQIRRSTSPGSDQLYNYDTAGRLNSVYDEHGDTCTLRGYGYNASWNRYTTSTSTDEIAPPSDPNTLCSMSTPIQLGFFEFDSADRSDSNTYDHLSRAVTTSGTAVLGGAGLTLGYYANDLVASLTQSGRTRGYILDPTQNRPATITDTAGPTLTNHYTDTGDSPAWTASTDGTWSRYTSGPASGLAAITRNDGSVELQLANLHGDIVATCTPSATGPAAYFESTEYGLPRDTNTTNPRYNWLGTHQRDTTTLGGLVLMGVRLYNPTTGRFLQPDPIPGGSANNYDYCNADPINCTDLNGKRCWSFRCASRWVSNHKRQIFAWSAGAGCSFITAGVLAGACVAGAMAVSSYLYVRQYRRTNRRRTFTGYFGAVWGAVSTVWAGYGGGRGTRYLATYRRRARILRDERSMQKWARFRRHWS